MTPNQLRPSTNETEREKKRPTEEQAGIKKVKCADAECPHLILSGIEGSACNKCNANCGTQEEIDEYLDSLSDPQPKDQHPAQNSGEIKYCCLKKMENPVEDTFVCQVCDKEIVESQKPQPTEQKSGEETFRQQIARLADAMPGRSMTPEESKATADFFWSMFSEPKLQPPEQPRREGGGWRVKGNAFKFSEQFDDCWMAQFWDGAIWQSVVGKTEQEAQQIAAQIVEDRNKQSWKCFHCDEIFTDKEQARLHFGNSECSTPACFIDATRLREMESQLRSYRNEDTELHREIHRLNFEHHEALRREEEKGYAKGLRDYTALEKERDELKADRDRAWKKFYEIYKGDAKV